MLNIIKIIYARENSTNISLKEFCNEHKLNYQYYHDFERGLRTINDIENLGKYLYSIGNIKMQDVYIDNDNIEKLTRYNEIFTEYLKLPDCEKKQNIEKKVKYIDQI